MKSLVVLFFLILSSLFAQFTAVTENDPSTLVEGVSVITGDLYTYEEDYIVRGAEPIRIGRSFISREGIFRDYQHLTATFAYLANTMLVNEHNGTTLYYSPDSQSQIHPNVGEYFYGLDKNYGPLKYRVQELAETSKGISNTTTGKISAQTNFKNQHIIFDPNIDKKGKSFTLYAADGTKRRYENFEGQKPENAFPFEGIHVGYVYKLVSETLPNGHIIHYLWNNKNQLYQIYATNYAQSKVFARVQIPNQSTANPTTITLVGSDNRSLTLKAHSTQVANLFVQSDVISPDLPPQSFTWDLKPQLLERKHVKRPYLQCLVLPHQRTMHISYSDVEDPAERQKRIDIALANVRNKIAEIKPKAKKKPIKYGQQLKSLESQEQSILRNGVENEGLSEGYLVKSLSSPVGKDSQPVITHSFFYDKPNKNSFVIDAKKNKTAYFWNDDFRLTRINRYIGTEELHNSELFLWGNALLLCKTLVDQKGDPIYSRVLNYDDRGNVLSDIFYGNLSGSSPSLQIGSNGYPIENGVEKFTKKSEYNNRNLLIRYEEGDLTTLYDYREDSQLLKSKELSAEDSNLRIRHEYGYDEDLILNFECVEDSITKLIKRITPLQSGSFVGMPEIIEEKYFNGTHEVLLRKMILHYEKRGLVEKKEVYDALGEFRYELNYKYDEKERLISETNPIGQVAFYQYDEVGNRTYSKDFSGRLETFYRYDFSNRLIEKEEVGDDGIHRTFKYSYGLKSNLESEIDPSGNETSYKYDSFGNKTETCLPSHLNDLGERLFPIIRQNYDSAGNLICYIDAEGNATRTTYNAYQKPVLITHPDGATEHHTYFLDGKLKDHTNSKGVVTSYKYDCLGRTTKISKGESVETLEYSGQYLTRKIDSEKNETLYTYDRAGRKVKEVFSGEETAYSYDEFGRVCLIQTGDLCKWITYDLLDRVIEEKSQSISGELLRKVMYEYDSAGNKKTITRIVAGKPAKEMFFYDSLNRLIERKDPLGNGETITYQDTGRYKKTHKDALGLETIELYDALNRISLIEKRKEKTLSLEEKFFHKAGQIAAQINTIYSPEAASRKITTRWEYDSRGRLITLIEAADTINAKITTHTYYPSGELKSTRKPNGTVLLYAYNDLGYLTSLKSSDQSLHYEMSYNLLGHLQSSNGISRTTDPKGRILSETFPSGLSVKNNYDLRGRRTTCQIPAANCSIAFDYNAIDLKKVSRRTLDQNILYEHQYTQHDLAGNILSEELISGQGTIQYQIDPFSRKTAITAPQFSQQILQFDPVGNICQMKIQGETRTYKYDPLYQLIEESGPFSHNYSFDSLYNRLQKDQEIYQINNLHQVVSHFEYDKNGNPTTNGDARYFYDVLDRLIRIETPNLTQIFTYDCLHRCLSKTTHQKNPSFFSKYIWGAADSKTEYFLYDGKNEIGAFDENLSPLELRILGDTPHAEIGASVAIELQGQIYAPIHDLQGNISALLGTDPTFYQYSAFGEEKIIGCAQNPWRFSSKRVENGLVYFGRRYYLPSFGRWLTPDPAGFTDGMNLYAYVHNDPLTHLDEHGLLLQPRPPGFFTAPDFFKRGVYHMEQFSTGVNRGLANAGFQTARLLNTLAHGIVSPFHSFDWQTRNFNFSMGQSYHSINSWLDKGQNAFDQYAFSSANHNHLLFKSGHLIGNLSGDFIIGGGIVKGGLGVLNAGKAALNPCRKLGLSRIPRVALEEKKLHDSILFGQSTVGSKFSHGPFKNKSIREVADALRIGHISPSELPINYIIRNEQIISFNNRSLLAFQRAKMEPTVFINRTGIEFYETELTKHLRGASPSPTIRVRGGPSGTSYVNQ